MTDCIIVGSGVAGISAALTLQANGKNFQIFGENKYTFYKFGLKSTMKYINCQEALRLR